MIFVYIISRKMKKIHDYMPFGQVLFIALVQGYFSLFHTSIYAHTHTHTYTYLAVGTVYFTLKCVT